ncbi:hypothetical protein MRX96_007229 [Rhipicephalus microplus]
MVQHKSGVQNLKEALSQAEPKLAAIEAKQIEDGCTIAKLREDLISRDEALLRLEASLEQKSKELLGLRDKASPEEFLECLENFCLVTGVAADKRLTQVVPAALEGGAKLWWRFVRGFDSREESSAAFYSELSSIDAKRRLKAELEQRTQHPEEKLKEFIYAIATFYDRIGEKVSEAEKVQRVLRQMHPQLQDLEEGHSYNDLAKLVKAVDGLMERAWRRFQYRAPPLPSNHVARGLAFHPSLVPDNRSLWQPNSVVTASFALFGVAPP